MTKRRRGRVPKYGLDLLNEVLNEQLLKLVHEIGHEFDQAGLRLPPLPKRPVGRPSTELEDASIAIWVYGRAAAEYRGKRNSVELAELDRYKLELNEAQRRRIPFLEWQKRHKEKRLRGLQVLRRLKAPGKAKVLRLPDWLESYIKSNIAN